MKKAIRITSKKDSNLKKYKRRLQLIDPFSKSDLINRNLFTLANAHLKKRNFYKATKIYKKIFYSKKYSNTSKIQSLKKIAKIHKLNNNKQAYLNQLNKISKFHYRLSKRNKKYISSYYNSKIKQARSEWNMNRARKAMRILNRLEKQVLKRPNYDSLARINIMRARINAEGKKFKNALFYLSRNDNFNLNYKTRELIDWTKAWYLRKLKRYQESTKILENISIENDKLSSFKNYKYKFWLAQNLQDIGEYNKSNKLFDKLTKQDPLGYHGLMAHRQLNRPFKKIKAKQNFALDKIPNHFSKHFVLVNWLIQVNEKDIAKNLLNHIFDSNKSKKLSKKFWLTLIGYYQNLNIYHSMLSRLHQFKYDERVSIFRQR